MIMPFRMNDFKIKNAIIQVILKLPDVHSMFTIFFSDLTMIITDILPSTPKCPYSYHTVDEIWYNLQIILVY